MQETKTPLHDLLAKESVGLHRKCLRKLRREYPELMAAMENPANRKMNGTMNIRRVANQLGKSHTAIVNWLLEIREKREKYGY